MVKIPQHYHQNNTSW